MVMEQDYSCVFSSVGTSLLIVKDQSMSNIRAAINQIGNKSENDLIIEELSHDEVDLQIQYNRVMYVLKRTIEKIKVVAYIPTFTQKDGKILKRYFEDETVQYILDVCGKDAVLMDNIGQRSFCNRRKDISPAILKNTKIDQAMLEVISILYNNKDIKKDIIEAPDTMYSEGATKLIQTMHMLYSACEHKLKMSAAQEKARQEQLRKAWRSNLIIKKDIQQLQKKLTEQRDNFAKEIYEKHKAIDKYQEQMEAVREQFKEKINKRVAESEKVMGLEAAASEIKIAQLTIEAKQLQGEYQLLLENHITYEKSLRAKRLKVETQLATWLAKYDQDIGDRSHEIEELTAAFDKEKAEMDALQELYDEQEEEYDVLMEEKAEEDRRLFEIKMYKILANIAARKIQRAWKKYWVRKQARLKARKAKAKDKKMGIIAPRKAESGVSKDSKASKGSKKKKHKKEKKVEDPKSKRQDNAAADFSKLFSKGDLLTDLSTPGFDTNPVTVEL